MAEAIDDYNRINDVRLSLIEIVSDNGAKLNVTDMVKHISIFEDITSPFLTGYMYLQDGMNIRQHLPINGNESVEVTFKTPGIENSQWVKLSLDVTSMSDSTTTKNDRVSMYKINFSSRIQRINEQIRINQNFKGCCSCVFTRILSSISPNSSCTVEKTKGEFDFVIPNLKPLDSIQFLVKKSISDKPPNNSNYMHYESIHGHNFVSMGFLTNNPVARDYSFEAPTTMKDIGEEMGMLRQRMTIQDYEITKEFDRVDDAREGVYFSTLITHDITTKQISVNYHNMHNDDTDTVNEYPVLPRESRWSNFTVDNLNVDSIGPTFFRPKQKLAFTHLEGSRSNASNDEIRKTNFYDPNGKFMENGLLPGNEDGIPQPANIGSNPDNFNPEDYLLSNRASTNKLGNSVLTVKVAGDTTLMAGMIVGVKIPSPEPQTTSESAWWDEFYSGKYMITSIRHQIDNTVGGGHTCVLELSRDSLPRPIASRKTIDLGEQYNSTQAVATGAGWDVGGWFNT